MAGEGGDNSALQARVAELERQCDALLAAQGSGRMARWFLLLVVLGMVGGLGYYIHQKIEKVTSKDFIDKMLAHLQKRQEELFKQGNKEIQAAYTRSGPKIIKTFQDQFAPDVPQYMKALQGQQEQLAQNLRTGFEKKLLSRADMMTDGFRQALKEEMAGSKETINEEALEKMARNFRAACERLGKQLYVDPLDKEIHKLMETLATFPPAPPPKAGDPPIEDQLKDHIYALFFEMVDLSRKASKAGAG